MLVKTISICTALFVACIYTFILGTGIFITYDVCNDDEYDLTRFMSYVPNIMMQCIGNIIALCGLIIIPCITLCVCCVCCYKLRKPRNYYYEDL